MNPYFQDDSVTIYHGDCREIVPTLGTFDLVCTDPPYNVNKNYGAHNDAMTPEEYRAWVSEVTDVCLKSAANQFWVAPRYKLELWMEFLPKSHLIVIPRGASGPLRAGWIDQFEIALAIGIPEPKITDLWNGIRLKGEGYFFREETYGHPGYTPFPIMLKAIQVLSKESVLEPFGGTGTTARAAKDLGRKCTIIELEEKYCEIAARRMEQEVLKL